MKKIPPNAVNKNKFHAGQLVWWTDIKHIGSKNIGIVQRAYKIEKGGRFLWYAEVFCFKEQKIKNILTTILHEIEK